jgi:hypothetical protein
MARETEDLAQAIATKEPLRRMRPSPSKEIWRLGMEADLCFPEDAIGKYLNPGVVLWDGSWFWDGSVCWSQEGMIISDCDSLGD